MSPSDHGRTGILVLAISVPIVLLVVVLAGDLPNTDWTLLYQISSVGFVAATALVATMVVMNGGRFLDSPIFYAALCYAAFIGIGPILATYSAGSSSDAVLSIEPKTIAVSWVGFIALFMGYLMTRPAEERWRFQQPAERAPVDFRTLETVGWFYLVLGLGGMAIYLSSVGGLGFLLSSTYGTRGLTPHLTEGLTYEATRPALLLLVFCAIARDRFYGARLFGLLFLGVFAMLWFGPLRGSRNQILTLMTALWFILTRTNERSYRTKMIGGIVCGIAVFLALVWGAQRAQHSLSDLDVSNAPVEETASASMYAPFKTLNDIVTYVPSRTPYLAGSSIIESVTIWIPRAFWPDKPLGIGSDAQDLFEARRGSNSVPTWTGELYWNFGWPGVIVGLVFMGAVCGWWARLLGSGGDSESELKLARLIYGVSFPVLLIWTWEGSDQAVWYFLWNILPIVLAIAFARRVALFGRVERRPVLGPLTAYGYQGRTSSYSGSGQMAKRIG